MKWKGWEFAQKKEPSRWITFFSFTAGTKVDTNTSLILL
jgi:hypothetical protein